jgi:hypothetical protein
MSKTIENKHKHMIKKFDIVNQLFNELSKFKTKRYTYLNSMYEDLVVTYDIGVISILGEYYVNKRSVSDYDMFTTCHNFNNKLNQCTIFLEDISNPKPNSKVGKLIKQYNSICIESSVNSYEYSTCSSCGGYMDHTDTHNEITCNNCGLVLDFHDHQEEIDTNKISCYDTSRHCRFWVQRIQAKECTEIPRECIDGVTSCIRRDCISDKRIKCSNIRSYLKEMKFTEYNDHIPLIRQNITGIIPPQLDHNELRKLYNIFDKSISAYDRIKPDGKSNTMYYPYIIFKILCITLQPGLRKKQILECIHLQSRSTLITNDNIWEKICKEIMITYEPTDKCVQDICT